MQQTYRTQTSVEAPTHRAYAPANSFSHARKLANPNARTVVVPNHDTLYSIGWLNLKRQPIVIHVPKVKGKAREAVDADAAVALRDELESALSGPREREPDSLLDAHRPALLRSPRLAP